MPDGHDLLLYQEGQLEVYADIWDDAVTLIEYFGGVERGSIELGFDDIERLAGVVSEHAGE